MVINLKISWIKAKNDDKSFRIFQHMGFDVNELEDLEKTDDVIKELIDKKSDTIILTNEVASFSGDIIKKYNKTDDINIIITPNKK